MIERRSRRAPPTCHPQAGFTLLETLVALLVFSLCLLMLAGIVGRLTEAGGAIRARSNVLDERRAITRLIATLVGSVDVELRDAARVNLEGGTERLDVLSIGPPVLDLVAPTVFSLRFRQDPGADPPSGSISLTWNDPESGALKTETIGEGVRAFALAYQERGSRGTWTNLWSRSVEDLALIRATIVFTGQGGSDPATTLFAVHGRLPRACVVDPLRADCPQW